MKYTCPKCGQPGGVLLFMTVAPCDRCVDAKPSMSSTGKQSAWQSLRGFVRWIPVLEGRVAEFRGDISIEVPQDATHWAWHDPPASVRNMGDLVKYRGSRDSIATGAASFTGAKFRYYWRKDL